MTTRLVVPHGRRSVGRLVFDVHGICRHLIGLLVASAIVLTVGGTGAATTLAECDGPVPSFRKALGNAQQIVIGDVIAVRRGGLLEPQADGRSSRFTLRVRHVLRGEAPKLMDIRDLVTQPCAGSIVARPGDRIAIAFDAIAFTPPMVVNSAAWIRGEPWGDSYERITETEIFERLGLDAPDTALATPDPPAHAPPLGLLPLLVSGLVGLILAWRRLGSRQQVPRDHGDRRPA